MIRALALLLCVVSVANAADYDVRPAAVKTAVRNGVTIEGQIVYSAKAMVPAAPVIYQTKTVVTAASTAGKLLRFGMSPAGYVSVSALQSFYEWYRDYGAEELGYTPGVELPGFPTKPGASGQCASGSVIYSSNAYSGPLMSGAIAQMSGTCGGDLKTISMGPHPYDGGPSLLAFNTAGAWCATTHITRNGCPNAPAGLPTWNLSGPVPVEWLPYLGPDVQSGESPVSDDEFWNALLNSPFGGHADMFRDLLDDANGVPWNTPEVQQGAEDIRRELASQDGTDPNTLPARSPGTSADPSNPDAPVVSPPPWEGAPSGGGSSGKTEVTKLPDFCTWATGVCDWLGWTQEPLDPLTDAPALPVVESSAATWDSGLGAGACPAPIEVAALGSSVSISWQPACDFVSMLRPILIAFAGIAAALILLGQRAGGAG